MDFYFYFKPEELRNLTYYQRSTKVLGEKVNAVYAEPFVRVNIQQFFTIKINYDE